MAGCYLFNTLLGWGDRGIGTNVFHGSMAVRPYTVWIDPPFCQRLLYKTRPRARRATKTEGKRGHFLVSFVPLVDPFLGIGVNRDERFRDPRRATKTRGK